VKAAADDARSSADKMQLISTTIPLAALIAGSVLVLALVAGAAFTPRRRTTAPPSVPAPPRELTPVP